MTQREQEREQQPRPRRRMWRGIVVGVGLLVLVGGALGIGFLVGHDRGWYRARAVFAQPAPPVPPGANTPPPKQRIDRAQTGPVVLPGGTLEIASEVSGAVEAAVVRVLAGGRVSGPINARDSVQVEGAVLSGVQAPVVEIGSRDRNGGPNDGRYPAHVLGAIQGRTVMVLRNGTVTGPILAGDLAEITGTVTGPVEAPRVILHAGAVVQGDVKVTGGQLILEPGARVNGALKGPETGVTLQMPPAMGPNPGLIHGPGGGVPYPPNGGGAYGPYQEPVRVYTMQRLSGWTYGVAGVLLLLGLLSLVSLLRAFLPEHVEEVAAALVRQPRRSLLLGLWSLLLTAAVGGVLAVTIIGIPLALALGLAALAGLVLGITAIAGVSGRKLLETLRREQAAPLTQSGVGAAAMGLLLFVPILGWLLLAGMLLAGFGASVGLWWPRLQGGWQNWRQRRRTRGGPPVEPS